MFCVSPFPFLLFLSRPKDRQHSVILHVRLLMNLRSKFTCMSDESIQEVAKFDKVC